MAMLSLRLPEDLEKRLPRRDRSAWVIEAIRERLTRERRLAVGRSAAEHAEEELRVLAEWRSATAAPPERKR